MRTRVLSLVDIRLVKPASFYPDVLFAAFNGADQIQNETGIGSDTDGVQLFAALPGPPGVITTRLYEDGFD